MRLKDHLFHDQSGVAGMPLNMAQKDSCLYRAKCIWMFHSCHD